MLFKLVEKLEPPFDHMGLISFANLAELINNLQNIKSLNKGENLQLAADGYGIDLFWNKGVSQTIVTKFGKEIYKEENIDALASIKKIIKILKLDGRLDK